MDKQLIIELKEHFNIEFQNVSLLEQAFTHSSYANEHRTLQLEDNERLEFLGDAVLELLVSRFLYCKFPNVPEGRLTKLRAAMVRSEERRVGKEGSSRRSGYHQQKQEETARVSDTM